MGGFEFHEPSRGLGPRSSGVLPALTRLSVSPRAPRQGRSPGGSPLGSSGTGVPVPAIEGAGAEARFHLRQENLWPKPQARLAGHGLAPWSAASQLPGQSPVLPDSEMSRSPFSAGGSAPTCVPLSAGQVPDRNPLLSLVTHPKASDLGRFTKPATFASAQGQARCFRMAAASSAARAFAPLPHRLVGQEAASLGLWLGRLPTLRSFVSATGWKLSCFAIRAKGIPTVDNEDNGHK